MLTGRKFRLYPTARQAAALAKWIGCQRVIRNAKIEETRLRAWLRKKSPFSDRPGDETHGPVFDQAYAHFIGESNAWLREVPSQILRNGVYRAKEAFTRYWKGEAGRPVSHKKQAEESVLLTNELFRLVDGRLFVGTERRPLGQVRWKAHRPYRTLPNMLTITRCGDGAWFASFTFEDGEVLPTNDALLIQHAFVREEQIVAFDRGVAHPLADSEGGFHDLEPKRAARLARVDARDLTNPAGASAFQAKFGVRKPTQGGFSSCVFVRTPYDPVVCALLRPMRKPLGVERDQARPAPPVRRKVEYRLYPTLAQAQDLERVRAVAAECYNLALRERVWLYGEWGRAARTGFVAQCAGLKFWRVHKPAWAAVHVHVLQVALKRLDLAFAAFFRRVAAGETPGFPRYRKADRLGGFGFKEHGNGWRLEKLAGRGTGSIKLHGLGRIKMRGHGRAAIEAGEPKTLEISERAGKWFASVSFALEALPQRARTGEGAAGVDWGVTTLATVVDDAGQVEEIANPRHLRQALKALRRDQRALRRQQKGSKRQARRRLTVARLHAKVGHRRRNHLHQTTARLAARYRVIAIEKLSPRAMSAHGGAHKRGFNRELLAASAGCFHVMLACKAEEAGGRIVEVDPRVAAPTQTCHQSGKRTKKPLGQRWHELPDGGRMGRDENAARVLLQYAMGREPTQQGGGSLEPPANCETPFQAHAWAA